VSDEQRTQAQKNIGLYKVVRYDIDQTVLQDPGDGNNNNNAPTYVFTEADRARARKNLGIETDYVRYDTIQLLTEVQKKRARDNIGVTNEKGDKGDTGAQGPAGPAGPPGPGLAIPDILGALSAVPGWLLSLLSLLISLLTACGSSTGDSDVDNQLNELRNYVIGVVNNLLNNGTFKVKRRPSVIIVDAPMFWNKRYYTTGGGGGGNGGGGVNRGPRTSIERNDFHSFRRVTNQTFNNRFSVERPDFHVNQRTVNQVVHQHRSVHLDHQHHFTLDYSKIAQLERRIAALEAQ
jgi:hypothetical protein